MLRIIKNAPLMGFMLLVLPYVSVSAAEEVKLNNQTSRASYSLGYQIGGDFKRQGLDIDAAAVVQGIETALSGAKPLLSEKAMRETLIYIKRKALEAERAKMGKNMAGREMELQYVKEGQKFLQENASKPGVKTTASGLQYKIIKPGTGKTPGPSDLVTVNYRGTRINGHEFDSSYKRGEPAQFALNNVIKGWTEGLQLIKEGGKIELYVPHKLAYGTRGAFSHRTLIFDIELISVGGKKLSGKS